MHVVSVVISDGKIWNAVTWEITPLPNGVIRIQRDDKTMGFIHKGIPQSKRLFEIAIDGIRDDITSALKQETQEASGT